MKHRKKVEGATSKRYFANLPKLQVADRVHAYKQYTRIIGAKRDEVPNIGFQPADFFSTHVEWMHQANIEIRYCTTATRRCY